MVLGEQLDSVYTETHLCGCRWKENGGGGADGEPETERMGKPRKVISLLARLKSGWCWRAGPGGQGGPTSAMTPLYALGRTTVPLWASHLLNRKWGGGVRRAAHINFSLKRRKPRHEKEWLLEWATAPPSVLRCVRGSQSPGLPSIPKGGRCDPLLCVSGLFFGWANSLLPAPSLTTPLWVPLPPPKPLAVILFSPFRCNFSLEGHPLPWVIL